jgi:hypothetical protein
VIEEEVETPVSVERRQHVTITAAHFWAVVAFLGVLGLSPFLVVKWAGLQIIHDEVRDAVRNHNDDANAHNQLLKAYAVSTETREARVEIGLKLDRLTTKVDALSEDMAVVKATQGIQYRAARKAAVQ